MSKATVITSSRIRPERVLADVGDPKAGGTVLFIGTVRDHSEAGEVDLIFYDAYLPMAEKSLTRIQVETELLWPSTKVSLVHRLGELKVGEVSVAVAVSADHRAEAFEACRQVIERIKHEVPIWKRERLADGSGVWVKGHPIRSDEASGPPRKGARGR
jgi:molybdopterin synthase catalytic subunit